jgi:alpha-tubulin suppressor-like RCC1 family protein
VQKSSRRGRRRPASILAAFVLAAAALPNVLVGSALANAPDPNAAVAVQAGNQQSCILMADGKVRCWGQDAATGVWLGGGLNSGSAVPRPVSSITTATAISRPSSGGPDCALVAAGEIDCWGNNGYGSLGDGTTTPSTVPVKVGTTDVYTAVATDLGVACAIHGGVVACWGHNDHGQLGQGVADGDNHGTPADVPGLTNVVSVAVSPYHACAARANGEVWCWGANFSGDLGVSTVTVPADSFSPVQAAGVSGAVSVSVGTSDSCALLGTGAINCWGSDSLGKLGDGPGSPTNSWDPATVSGITTAVEVSMNDNYNACARTSDGKLWCWGMGGYGELGNNTYTSSDVPVEVSGITTAVSVSSGVTHSCGVLSDGSLNCWGDGTGGTLGTGSTAPSKVPAVVSLVPDTTAPTMTALTLSTPTAYALATAAATAPVRVQLTWAGTDNRAVDHYVVERSLNGSATWTTLDAWVTILTKSYDIPSSGTVRLRVTAIDLAGNPSTPRVTATLTPRIVQESKVTTWTGKWTKSAYKTFSGGALKSTVAKGASASYTFTGRAIAIVVNRSATSGNFAVYIGGKKVATVNTSVGAATARFVVWSTAWSTSAKRTIKIVNLAPAGRTKIALDAFIVVK